MARILKSTAALLAAAATGASAADYELVAHLKQRNLDELERLFWRISDPDDAMYLKHRTIDQVSALIGASDEELRAASSWLLSKGATRDSLRVSPLRDSVTATFPSAGGEAKGKQFFSTIAAEKPAAIEFVVRRDALENEAVPQGQAPLETDEGFGEYTVSNIKKAYGIPTDLAASNETTLQMVWGPGTFGYSKTKLGIFKATQCPQLNMDKIKFDTPNHGQAGGDNFGEGQLDTQMISSFGLNVETIVSNTNSSASTEEGEGFGQALLDFLTELQSRQVLPQVMSLSLGSLSSKSCEILCEQAAKRGHTEDECESYMQQQRQVCMYLSDAQTQRISTAFQVLGVRGMTIFGSSGDGGSHFSFGKFSGGAIADTLNEIACEFQLPVFPTGSPYVVSVGGEMWEGDSSHPVTWAGFGGGSGSGFSWQMPMPEYQKTVVNAYLQNTENLPPKTSFNAQGRAYPDISSIAVSGTSQSSPMTAGIFSMLIDKRLNAGLPPLGFVAPRIYKVAQQHPGEAFEDITKGNSKTSCDNGFPSTTGWDPNTGFGRPVWDGLVKYFASDSNLQKSVDVIEV
eukprot:TRINITY_DN15355_c0_g1_i1.p1 TRINITY_DN15355_c0_g1~~TRINITY_DN15355_c0_g1_i1.p1  ORF type:complete len:571 (+),score=111.53 TRINITY_DN15355_c0_g1_i1:319-2031(+)